MFSYNTHRFVYVLALAIIACSLPFSVFTTSVGSITLLVNFVLEGNWRFKYNNLKQNRLLWVWLFIYLPILYSSFYSSSTSIAIKELRLWLPFVVLPLVVATNNPLSYKEFRRVLLLFVLAVFVATLISTTYFATLSSYEVIDVRKISLFISHIRFALMVNLAMAILFYLVVFDTCERSRISKGIMIVIFLWLLVFLFILQSLTGIVMLFLMLLLIFFWFYFKIREAAVRFVLATLALMVIFLGSSSLTHQIEKFYTRNKIDLASLPERTQNGNAYQHDTVRLAYENGNLIYINVCSPELQKEWERRSRIKFDGLDKKGQNLEQTLLRYMTSLGLTKDSAGVAKLDSIDVNFIESGAASVIFRNDNFGIDKRLYQLLWEFDAYRTEGLVDRSSVIQRFVYARAAWFVIKKHLWFGVGWGDIHKSLDDFYRVKQVNLEKDLRFMPHNQYLTVWVGAGILGLLVFIVAFVFPFLAKKEYKNFLSLYFFLMIMVSMLNEDTFESHIGITFAVLFYSLFIFGFSFKPKIDESEPSSN
ncbi:MAG: O-antigen ligase family protein [Bacteroidales bacterium]